MPQVYRIDQGKKVSVFIPDHIWEKIQRKPKVFGRYKWELAPKPILKYKSPLLIVSDDKKPHKKSTFKKPTKKIIIDDDLAGKSDYPTQDDKARKYTEIEYREDLKSAKSALKFGNKKGALILYKRAFKFKKSLYVKTKIKELS